MGVPLSMDQIRRVCPAAFNTTPIPGVGSGYVPISTASVIERMAAEGYAVRSARQKMKKFMPETAKHMITFRKAEHFNFSGLKVGAAIPEVVMTNGHGANSAFNLYFGLYRIACLNGMIVGATLEHLRVRHIGTAALEVVENSNRIMAALPQLDEWVDKAQSTTINEEQQRHFARRAAAIRWGTEVANTNELLTTRRAEDGGATVWNVFNRVQENLIRGGVVQTIGATGRRTTSKEITDVDKVVDFNRALWDLGTELLRAA